MARSVDAWAVLLDNIKMGVMMNESYGDKEVLVVISKVKKYIRSVSGMNTAGSVAPALSDVIRNLCDQAVERARKDRRKTVMDRDFQG